VALDSGTRLGPYEILAPLGAGGMGEVYRARDTRLDRLVAVKVLHADATSSQAFERFEREAKAIAALNHPGICAIYDVGTSPVPFLVMELLDGDTLHQRLARGPMDAPLIVDTGLALADALSAAHAKGILHRDLKPANIVLTPRGPKILDFGLARATESVATVESGASAFETLAAQSPLTDVGVAVGTASYMSPEQLRGEPLDARTDLFSLGLVLYEMATGRRAFSGATSAVTTAAILHEHPAAPRQLRPDLSPRLEQAILTLLEKDREVRTQTASELRAELTRMRRELGGARASDSGRSNEERGLQTSPSSEMAAAASPSVSTAAVAPAAPASSSDAQLIAGVMRRHRGAVVGSVALLLLVVVVGAYLATRSGAENISGETRTRPSIADLKVEQLTTSGTAGTPAISPDGNYVAYVETGPKGESLRVRQVATASNVEILAPEPGIRLFAPAVTPDGTFVDYLKRVGPQRFELWQIPFLGGAPRQLLTGIGSGVAFSPDARRIAYVRSNATGQTEVMIAAADGSGAQVLATRQAPNGGFLTIPGTGGLGWYAPAWSPDGTTLAVLGGRIGFTGQVVFIDAQTGKERVVEIGPPLPGISLEWLDEGTLILSLLDRSSAPIQLWLLSYPKGEFSRLTNDLNQYVGLSMTADRSRLVTARSEASFSIWTSEAAVTKWTQIVPTTPQKGPIGFDVAWLGDDLIFPSMASGSWTLERWRASTRTTETLAPAGGLPQVSRDGSIVFFDYDAGELLKMDASGRNKTRVGRGNSNLRLTPDGQQLTFIDTASGTPTVRIRPIDGAGDAREITTDHVRPGGGAQVSPDGRRIAYSSFDDQKRPATTVCDFATCGSKRTFPLAGVRWAPDSQGIAYLDPRAPADIWIQPLDGGAARQLTHFPADGQQIWGFAWSADGKRLAVGRASIKNNIVLFRGLKQPAR
jgi:serine/threonine protein kinase/Tol biopolymer transport system component